MFGVRSGGQIRWNGRDLARGGSSSAAALGELGWFRVSLTEAVADGAAAIRAGRGVALARGDPGPQEPPELRPVREHRVHRRERPVPVSGGRLWVKLRFVGAHLEGERLAVDVDGEGDVADGGEVGTFRFVKLVQALQRGRTGASEAGLGGTVGRRSAARAGIAGMRGTAGAHRVVGADDDQGALLGGVERVGDVSKVLLTLERQRELLRLE